MKHSPRRLTDFIPRRRHGYSRVLALLAELTVARNEATSGRAAVVDRLSKLPSQYKSCPPPARPCPPATASGRDDDQGHPSSRRPLWSFCRTSLSWPTARQSQQYLAKIAQKWSSTIRYSFLTFVGQQHPTLWILGLRMFANTLDMYLYTVRCTIGSHFYQRWIWYLV